MTFPDEEYTDLIPHPKLSENLRDTRKRKLKGFVLYCYDEEKAN